MTLSRNTTDKYQNFNVAIYATMYDVQDMADLDWLKDRFDLISHRLKVDKVYLETHRDAIMVDEETIVAAREFFRARGIRTSGGITLTVNERNRFQTCCYTNSEHWQKVQEIVEYTTLLFDELICVQQLALERGATRAGRGDHGERGCD